MPNWPTRRWRLASVLSKRSREKPCSTSLLWFVHAAADISMSIESKLNAVAMCMQVYDKRLEEEELNELMLNSGAPLKRTDETTEPSERASQ